MTSVPQAIPTFHLPADKSPQLMDFVAQIKSNTDTAQLFESIQADATITISSLHSVESMDLS